MRRVHVIGGSCTGKTTTARNLAELLGVPHIELDALHHDPNWTEVSAEVMQARVRAALAAAPDGWVVDGNYFGKLGNRVLEQADTVVWLDLPFHPALRRVVWRTFSRALVRTELWNGNRELLRNALGRNSIILWCCERIAPFRRSGRRASPGIRISRWFACARDARSATGFSRSRRLPRCPAART